MAFKINFSDADRDQEGRSAIYNSLPTGDYPCVISDIDLAEVKSGPNQGKFMFKVTLTVEDEENETANGRKFWPNIMLFEIQGGNWFLAQFLKATGNADALTTGNVPEAEAYLGKKVIANVKRVRDKYNEKDQPEGTILYKNEVKGFMPFSTETVAKGKAKKTNSLLP